MNNPVNVILTVCAALLLSGQAATAKLNVVASTPDLGAIAQSIGGNAIELSIIAKPTEDPHFVDAKPSQIVKLKKADVLIEGGAELEIGWLPALLDQARNPKLAPGTPGRVACAQGIALKEIPSTLDRSQGDIHAAGNPHYLVDPGNAVTVAKHIAKVFSSLDPAVAALFQTNLQTFQTALESKLVEWHNLLAPFKGQELACYHSSWLYFGERFGLKPDLFLEPKPGVPPTPTHLAEVISRMKQDHVRVILVDPYLDRRTAEVVAAKTGARVVDVAQFPGGLKGTDGGYIPLLDRVVTSIAAALNGQ